MRNARWADTRVMGYFVDVIRKVMSVAKSTGSATQLSPIVNLVFHCLRLPLSCDTGPENNGAILSVQISHGGGQLRVCAK